MWLEAKGDCVQLSSIFVMADKRTEHLLGAMAKFGPVGCRRRQAGSTTLLSTTTIDGRNVVVIATACAWIASMSAGLTFACLVAGL